MLSLTLQSNDADRESLAQASSASFAMARADPTASGIVSSGAPLSALRGPQVQWLFYHHHSPSAVPQVESPCVLPPSQANVDLGVTLGDVIVATQQAEWDPAYPVSHLAASVARLDGATGATVWVFDDPDQGDIPQPFDTSSSDSDNGGDGAYATIEEEEEAAYDESTE